MTRRPRDERGIAFPSPVALVSIAAVVLAGLVFVTTNDTAETPATAAKPVVATATPSARSTAPEPVLEEKDKPEKHDKKKRKPKPEVDRSEVYVEVYNNSGISGLAGSTASRASGAGWQVVGSDNWYGTIPTSTVYYPPRLRTEAKLLAKDLGIDRLKPAIAPMRMDRLTVILTGA